MPALPVEFYQRDPTQVARDLLGKILVRRARDGLVSGRIVEVEAYLSEQDSACHAARGRTRSNAAMFGPAGRAYVYPIHSRYCFNTVTQQRGIPSAVLVRAIEPIAGVALMRQRRQTSRIEDLARGPARLCQALQIDRQLDHWDLSRGQRLWIEDSPCQTANSELARSGRIGVTSAKELLLRFFVRANAFVSGTRQLNESGESLV